MPYDSTGPAMRQKIFSMRLDVETVSLYLLCCAVADAGGAITPDTLADKWNGNRTGLEQALDRLRNRNILSQADPDGKESRIYRMVDEKNWK